MYSERGGVLVTGISCILSAGQHGRPGVVANGTVFRKLRGTMGNPFHMIPFFSPKP